MRRPRDAAVRYAAPLATSDARGMPRAVSAAARHILISEFMDEEAVEGLRRDCAGRDCSLRYEPGLAQARDDLLAAVAAARALIVRNVTRVDRELLDAAPALEVVGRLGVGLDNIDLDACAERGIAVFPATGANAVSVAEYVLTAMLLLRRPAYGATSRVAAGEWPRQELGGRELAGSRLGLIGLGAVARAVAERASALGMRGRRSRPLPPAGRHRMGDGRARRGGSGAAARERCGEHPRPAHGLDARADRRRGARADACPRPADQHLARRDRRRGGAGRGAARRTPRRCRARRLRGRAARGRGRRALRRRRRICC